ncbi:protein-L-isoaspartate(D-aspartate) O-methyltransferase [candidate division WOR-3 bacterium]|jgi:protein-L-isoaspartate(D-aspartate) O-methyltransferase|nr:protein-L-isoaspartate(D-aspartate) O-methyltransferase [candidate division WOR-3 bacterium]MCK4756759.1 protein-L-isoaspartate(D-aspartate) O-methyltransferase [candidate division WOR-3 bacterium]
MIEVKEWIFERERMVKEQIIARGIKDNRVIEAIKKVPRHLFVDKTYYHQAYNDYPLPIGQDQTISQPYMVAAMTEILELKGSEKVLEVGTGSGYQTAILALLCSKVYSIERISDLTRKARLKLDKLGFRNINLVVGDGSLGWPDYAPYTGIMVTAGAPEIPNTLINQLDENGRLVIPVGDEYSQILNLVKKHKGRIYRKEFFGCTFVPLVGKIGWHK